MTGIEPDPAPPQQSPRSSELESESFQRELAAVAEVGERRSRARVVAAVVSFGTWVVAMSAGGVPLALIITGLVGGGAAFISSALTARYIDEAAERHGVPRRVVAGDLTDVGRKANPYD